VSAPASAGRIRQVWVTAPRTVEIRDVECPRPGAGEALVAPARAGICGSDLHTYRHRHPWLDYPIGPGHEVSGVVLGVGDDAGPLRPDDRVYLTPGVACGTCRQCKAGRSNICEQLIGVGAHLPGGMADAFVAPASALRPLPSRVSFAAGAMIEPLAAAVHAVSMAGGVGGRSVAVIGGGTIGLACAVASLADGAAVAVVEPFPAKRELAERLGARALEPGGDLAGRLAEACGGPPEVVFDCVATPGTVRDSLLASARGGVVVIVGVGSDEISLPLAAIQDDERTVVGSSMYVDGDFLRAEALVRDGAPVELLVTRTMPLDAATEAFAVADGGAEIKVQFSFPVDR